MSIIDKAKDLLKKNAKIISNAEDLRRNQNIEDVVAALEDAKKHGKNVYYPYEMRYRCTHWDNSLANDKIISSEFNGMKRMLMSRTVNLYSVDVTLDSAYESIYGIQKKEFDNEVAKLVNKLPSAIHEERRRVFFSKENGTFVPKWREIKDQGFIASLNPGRFPSNIQVFSGNYEIDIANSTYDQLSPDLKYQYEEAAKVCAKVVVRSKMKLFNGSCTERVDIDEERFYHEWLKRNDRSKDAVSIKGLPDWELPEFRIGFGVANEVYRQLKLQEQQEQQELQEKPATNDIGMER